MGSRDEYFGMGQQAVEGQLGAPLPADDPGDVIVNPGPRAILKDAYGMTENAPNQSILGPRNYGQKRLGHRE